jgi:hypothetical protein
LSTRDATCHPERSRGICFFFTLSASGDVAR